MLVNKTDTSEIDQNGLLRTLSGRRAPTFFELVNAAAAELTLEYEARLKRAVVSGDPEHYCISFRGSIGNWLARVWWAVEVNSNAENMRPSSSKRVVAGDNRRPDGGISSEIKYRYQRNQERLPDDIQSSIL